MKPTARPIDSTKRTFVPPPPELDAKAALNIVRVFACLLALPLLFEVAAWLTPSKTNLAAATVRSGMQWLLTRALSEGNREVYLGREGWLFNQSDIDRVVHAKRQESALHAEVVKLAAKLKAQEVALMVVIIPARLAIYPEQIRSGRYAGPLRVKEEAARIDELKAAGAEVLDMTDPMWNFSERNEAFFPHDSHWTPEAMKAVALALNKHVREKFPRLGNSETPIINATILENADTGDLARRLDPRHAANLMGSEEANLISIQGIDPDTKSPIVLHGGELMRVYDDPTLSFGGSGRAPRAGFATQFTTLMGRSLDVRGMPRPEDSYDDKKLVICVLPMAELVP